MNPSDTEKKLDFLKVFQEISRLINMARAPQEVMERVVGELPALLGADAATIRLLDEGTGDFVLGAASGVSEQYLARPSIASAEVMEELRRGMPAVCDDLVRTECAVIDVESCDQIQREGVKSVLSLPILYQEKTIGILRLLTRRPRHFTEEEVRFAMSLAEQVGIAISKTRYSEEMQNQLKFFQELREISRLVNSTLELETILTAIVNKLPEIMGVTGCTIRLVQPATNRLELVAASGLSDAYLSRGSISREDSIIKVLKGEPVAIYDATKDPRVEYHQAIAAEGIRSILVVPIRNELEIIGVLRLLTRDHHVFTPGEINFAMTVAEEGGNAIAKARTYRKITLLFNQLEESERFLQGIMDSLLMQLLVLDPNRRIVLVNRSFLEEQSYREEELLGRRYREIVSWGDAAEETAADLDRVYRDRCAVTNQHRLAGDHTVRWFERQLTPMLDDRKEVEFVIEAVWEITEQKKLEQSALDKMKLQGVVEMAGAAAHELNTPLFAALGTAQLLREDLLQAKNDIAKVDLQLLGSAVGELELIENNLQRIAAITKEMVTATGFESESYVGNTSIARLKR